MFYAVGSNSVEKEKVDDAGGKGESCWISVLEKAR